MWGLNAVTYSLTKNTDDETENQINCQRQSVSLSCHVKIMEAFYCTYSTGNNGMM
jgi:hypothetical protein